MRMIHFTGAALIAALVAVTATAATAGSAKKVKFTCTVRLQTLAAPGASGEDFGTVACTPVFGKGVQHDTITVTPTSQTTATGTGPFKAFFDTGTIHGTTKLAAGAPSGGVVTYTGTLKFTGGTGAYKHVRGSGTSECSSPDGGTHTACTSKGTVTGI
jgi:hypothetical protein